MTEELEQDDVGRGSSSRDGEGGTGGIGYSPRAPLPQRAKKRKVNVAARFLLVRPLSLILVSTCTDLALCKKVSDELEQSN